MPIRRLVVAPGVALALLAGGAMPSVAEARSCPSVQDPYAGTRYAGADLSRIQATGVSCAVARKVARGAHRKALGMTPTGPVRRLTWKGWKVRGDLRGSRDRYTATRGGKTVRWRF